MTGLQARVVGPVLTGLLEQKKVVRTQIRKPSGKGETWYDGWRLATNTEFLAAKIEELGLTPRGGEKAGGRTERQVGVKGGRWEDEDDTDWLDEVEAGSVQK
jgi:hypothetical protein